MLSNIYIRSKLTLLRYELECLLHKHQMYLIIRMNQNLILYKSHFFTVIIYFLPMTVQLISIRFVNFLRQNLVRELRINFPSFVLSLLDVKCNSIFLHVIIITNHITLVNKKFKLRWQYYFIEF